VVQLAHDVDGNAPAAYRIRHWPSSEKDRIEIWEARSADGRSYSLGTLLRDTVRSSPAAATNTSSARASTRETRKDRNIRAGRWGLDRGLLLPNASAGASVAATISRFWA